MSNKELKELVASGTDEALAILIEWKTIDKNALSLDQLQSACLRAQPETPEKAEAQNLCEKRIGKLMIKN